jgi:hypothetical protein
MISRKKLSVLGLLLLLALSSLILASCAAQTEKYMPQQDYYYAEDSGTANKYETQMAARDGAARPPEPVYGAVTQATERRVILTGQMELTVKDTRETVSRIKSIVAAAGGIVSNAEISELKEGLFAAGMTLRVPAARFDSIMDQLEGLGKAARTRFDDRDVTMEYLDLEARLKNLRAQEERYREILDLAITIDDVLKVERELNRVRGEIEAMSAQFTYLQDQVAFSTINLWIREEAIATQAISPAPFENLGTRIKESFVRSINTISTVFAGLIVSLAYLLPVLAILTVAVILVRCLVIRRARRKTPAA